MPQGSQFWRHKRKPTPPSRIYPHIKIKINKSSVTPETVLQNTARHTKKILLYILSPTELHLKNVNYLYSASSDPTNVV